MDTFNRNSFSDDEMRFSLAINYSDCPEWIRKEVDKPYGCTELTDDNTRISIIAYAHTYQGITLCDYELEMIVFDIETKDTWEGDAQIEIRKLELDTDEITELWTAIREKCGAFLDSLDLDPNAQVLEFAEKQNA